jgi:hypothetical protein
MRAYLLMALFALFMALAAYPLAATQHLFVADAVSPDLSKALGVDEGLLRKELEVVLRRGSGPRAIMNGLPWLLLCGCFLRSYWKALRNAGGEPRTTAPSDAAPATVRY